MDTSGVDPSHSEFWWRGALTDDLCLPWIARPHNPLAHCGKLWCQVRGTRSRPQGLSVFRWGVALGREPLAPQAKFSSPIAPPSTRGVFDFFGPRATVRCRPRGLDSAGHSILLQSSDLVVMDGNVDRQILTTFSSPCQNQPLRPRDRKNTCQPRALEPACLLEVTRPALSRKFRTPTSHVDFEENGTRGSAAAHVKTHSGLDDCTENDSTTSDSSPSKPEVARHCRLECVQGEGKRSPLSSSSFEANPGASRTQTHQGGHLLSAKGRKKRRPTRRACRSGRIARGPLRTLSMTTMGHQLHVCLKHGPLRTRPFVVPSGDDEVAPPVPNQAASVVGSPGSVFVPTSARSWGWAIVKRCFLSSLTRRRAENSDKPHKRCV